MMTRFPRSLLPAALCALLLTGVCELLASRAARADEEQRISFTARDERLRDVIARLCKEGALVCKVAADVPPIRITLDVRDVSPAAALRLVIRQAALKCPGLGFGRDGDAYEVRIAPIDEQERQTVLADPPDPRLKRRIEQDLFRVPLREGFRRLFAGSEARFAIEPDVPDLTVDVAVAGMTAFEAIRKLVETATWQAPELELTRERGTYALSMRRRAAASPSVRRMLQEKKVTLSLVRTPLKEALGRIFSGSGLQYTMQPTLPQCDVTLEIRDATLEKAIQALIEAAKRQVPGLSLGQDGDVLILETRGTEAAKRPAKGDV